MSLSRNTQWRDERRAGDETTSRSEKHAARQIGPGQTIHANPLTDKRLRSPAGRRRDHRHDPAAKILADANGVLTEIGG
jgi:hypothetical protein